MVNFGFFEALSADESRQLLETFLAEEREAMPRLTASAMEADITLDFSIASIPSLLDWIRHSVTVTPREPDPDLPEWIRSSDSYTTYLFDFDEPSRVAIVRGAYYLGESFARAFDHLQWDVGRAGTAPQGQPVITGFKYEMEMPVLLVAENTIARALAEPTQPGRRSPPSMLGQPAPEPLGVSS